jgi:ubiquinone/menaquinone biosynthesis C-methylase UbiE
LTALGLFLKGSGTMKMTALEKHFVNSPGHAAKVAGRAQALLGRCAIQPGQHYLDVGCGAGAAARSIAQTRPLDVTGIDVDPDQIQTAESGPARPNLHYLTMDATALQFRDAQFDIVATSKTLHHIPNWRGAFREMVRVLREGGYLVFTDFALPPWLPSPGLTSERQFDEQAAQTGLTRIYRRRSWVSVDFIWRKDRHRRG